ncbi:MFS transporter [Bartonella sp. HY329]|uniref:MFS transporter n=1 Tax=unclassified Bartonella TaxID=2645622 RepID=UPI0021C87EE0|nr:MULTISPECIES: MFS transporter [unclassified Bartonella]UXM94366.1 MFS transporter [Bartonella sp. HY329]UXN08689.1 MFS transporter [Bartonella sp. HY328]
MQQTQDQQHSIPKRDVAAVVLGNAIEYFDFILYATFTVIISEAFFPFKNGFWSLFSTVLTFSVGFIARPLGAIFIGQYADRAGRKAAMLLTMVLMAIGTGGMVILPDYAKIGIFAPILLVFIRLIQGLAWGGEAGPSITFMMEAAPANRRAFFTSWQIVAQGCAAIIAGLFGFFLAKYLTPQQLASWGWRIPFAIGLIILPLGLLMRRHLKETYHAPKSIASVSSQELIISAWVKYRRMIILGILVLSGATITQYFLNYMTTYALTELKLTADYAMVSTIVMGIAMVSFGLIGGLCADRFGRKKTIIIPRLILLFLLFPGLYIANLYSNVFVFYGVIIVFTALQNISGAGLVVLLCESFPQYIRASGFSMTYALGIAIFGGTAQPIFTLILQYSENPLSPAYYLIITNIICIVATVLFTEHKISKR